MAVGFTIDEGRLSDLHTFLNRMVTWQTPPVPTLDIDGLLSITGTTESLAKTLEQLGPFGNGNVEPRFALKSVRVIHANRVGNDHVSCVIADDNGTRLRAIAFRVHGTPLGTALLGCNGVPLHLAGTLFINDYQNAHVQFRIEDGASIWKPNPGA
jgi:single-stranded-DNA-specific exonuclease